MRTKAVPIIIILLICVALTVGILALHGPAQPAASTEPRGDTPPEDLAPGGINPPLICVNNALYEHKKIVTSDALDETYTYIGNIESLVPLSEIPTENFQANGGIYLGSHLYQSGTNIIAVYGECYDLYSFERKL